MTGHANDSARDPSDDEVAEICRTARTIAVLGAHHNPARPAHYVGAYVQGRGCRVIPVNQTRVGHTLFDEPVRASLAEIEVPVDIVDVFRRAEDVPAHVDDILAMTPLPKTVWLQLGIRNDDVAQKLRARGITVVQDRCLLVDHRNYAR